MQHDQEVKKILYQHNYDFSNINFKTNLNNTIDQIEHELIYKSISSENAEKIVCDLRRLKQSVNRQSLKDGILKEELDQLKNNSYTIENDFIICHKFIGCESIRESRTIHPLNQKQMKQLVDHGYGIKLFKVAIDTKIKDLICHGKHPNLGKTNAFCWDENLRGLDFTSDNLSIIEGMLSSFNLDSCFIQPDERQFLIDIARSENQKCFYL